jgi:acyl-CoA synthetase (NDP forming)
VAIDLCDYLAYCLDDPETTSVILFLEGFRRPERFLALADRALELGKPIMAVKVGRSGQAQEATIAHSGSLAGEARATEAALNAAGVICCRDLDELLEMAELVEGCRRTGRRVGRGRAGVVTVSTGEASLIADMAPETGIELPPIPDAARKAILDGLPTMGYIGNPLDPWGAADPATAYGVVFEALASSGVYDVLVLVHDFPYKSLKSEIVTAGDVALQLLESTRDRHSILPVYVSLTSGDPPPETQELLREKGSGAPLLRGAAEAFTAIAALARWERRHERRLDRGPWRESWPALAANPTPFSLEPPTMTPVGTTTAWSEADTLTELARAAFPVTAFRRAATADEAVEAARRK